MPRSKQTKSSNAIAMLKADHQKVKHLFDEFEKTDESEKQRQIAEEAIKELKIHTVLEEELFYPAVRNAIQDDENIMNEAQEEHHVAKMLIAELEKMSGGDDQYQAKFMVLAESVRHHIKEEEGDMLPEARKTDVDFKALGEQMKQRKEELMNGEIPASKEEELVSGASR